LVYLSIFLEYFAASGIDRPLPAAKRARVSLAASHTDIAEPTTAPAAGTMLFSRTCLEALTPRST
jgi:hypothetical protein